MVIIEDPQLPSWVFSDHKQSSLQCWVTCVPLKLIEKIGARWQRFRQGFPWDHAITSNAVQVNHSHYAEMLLPIASPIKALGFLSKPIKAVLVHESMHRSHSIIMPLGNGKKVLITPIRSGELRLISNVISSAMLVFGC